MDDAKLMGCLALVFGMAFGIPAGYAGQSFLGDIAGGLVFLLTVVPIAFGAVHFIQAKVRSNEENRISAN